MKRTITVLLERELYDRVGRAAKEARQSRSGWMALAAIEKLTRLDAEKRGGGDQPARPVEKGSGGAA